MLSKFTQIILVQSLLNSGFINANSNLLVLRSIRKWWYDRRYRRPGNADEALPRWENDYWLHEEPEFRMFYEYLDMGKCSITSF